MKYDIFISYRRDGGEDRARLINKKLKEMGYKVFFDHDAALCGHFETVIKTAIENSKAVVLVLSKECFLRCNSKKDFVRREIEHAQRSGIEIVPIFPVGDIGKYEDLFNVDDLPQSILELKKIQIASIDFHENFEISCEYQIKKSISPSIVSSNKNILTESIGAKVHIITDTLCMVYTYGCGLGMASPKDGKYGKIIRLRKGRHKLHFESVDDEEVQIDIDFTVPDNDYVDYIEVKLEPIKKKLEKSKAKKWNNYKKWVIQKRNGLNLSKNYLILYDFSTLLYARNVAVMLQQIGNKCHIQDAHDLVKTQKIDASFDEKLLGKKNILVFLKKDYDKELLNNVINIFEKYDHESIIFILFGNVVLPSTVVADKIINIAPNLELYQAKVDVVNKVCFPIALKSTEKEDTEGSNFKNLVNVAGLNMKFIEGGTYIPGDELFRHSVTISDFYLSTTTLTNEQWQHFMGGDILFNQEDCPVTNKSINEIKEFIDKLNAATGKDFFLPSEEEWEYAARGGKESKKYEFSGSNILEHVGWYKDNSQNNRKAREVDAPNSSKVPNELGLWFMSGNVWEICKEYGSEEERYILRGGSYDSDEEDCKVSSRIKLDLTHGYKQVGFRLAYRPKK